MTVKFNEGDKIRLSYIGYAYKAGDYGGWDIVDDRGDIVLTFDAHDDDVIEVLERRKPQVGDVLDVKAGESSGLPVASVVVDGAGSHYFKTHDGWAYAGSGQFQPAPYAWARRVTIEYIPE